MFFGSQCYGGWRVCVCVCVCVDYLCRLKCYNTMYQFDESYIPDDGPIWPKLVASMNIDYVMLTNNLRYAKLEDCITYVFVSSAHFNAAGC
jgi:hypothetical protein